MRMRRTDFSNAHSLILAPTFFSAAIYTLLGYLINRASRRSPRAMSARTYLIVFITCDILALVLQAIGGAMAAIALQNSEESTTGTHIMVSGIAAQVRHSSFPLFFFVSHSLIVPHA